jgi:hypothetical protein
MKKQRKYSTGPFSIEPGECTKSNPFHTIRVKFLANVEHNRSIAGQLRRQEHLLPFVNVLYKK